jgi:hypothetical protein
MKLIELYLNDIRRRLLLRKNRDDIIEEIRSTLMDTIEGRNPNPGQEPDEETVKAVLKEYGSPRKVAAQYGTKNYLIGPRLFPVYILVLKIVLIVVGVVGLVGIFIAMIGQSGFDSGVLGIALQMLGDLFGSLFAAFGFVTLSFAAIERTAPEEWEVDLDEDWEPDFLHEEEDREHIKIAELAIEITMNIIFIALINFFIDKIGIYYLTGSVWNSVPILNDNFSQYIPWITSYIVLDIALALYLIRTEYWDNFSSIAKILINIFKIAVTFAILTGPAIITVDTIAWQALFPSAEMTSLGLSSIANTVLNVLLGLSIFGMAVDSIKRLYLSFIKGRALIKFKAE